jgi:hypothetical protein
MSISVHFTHKGLTSDKYDEAISLLEAQGLGAPAGRRNHFALDADGEIEVLDIWESPQALDAFAPVLVPIFTELGVQANPPTIRPVHHTITN